MDDIRSGKVKGALFLFFIVLLIVGGYFTVFYLTKDSKNNSNNSVASKEDNKDNKDNKDNRINKNEEYIYYTNIMPKDETKEIIYEDVVFNFASSDARTIETLLNNENKELIKTYKLMADVELSEEDKEKIIYKESDVYEAKYNKYTRYFYKNYATILSELYTYSAIDGSKNIKSSSYVFDTNTGKLLSKKDIRELYNLTLDKLKEKVKEKLDTMQTTVDDVPEIDIASTLNGLDDDNNYALYINKSGYLIISYFIKSMQETYNDVIILN